MPALAIGPADVRQASERIRPLAHRTVVLRSTSVDKRTGLSCYFKCENLQRGGSFKIRGAANRILSIDHSERSRGVVAFSSGNHAQATAIVAEELKIPATIVMPLDAPTAKVAGTKSRGARIITYDRFKEDREVIAKRVLGETGGTLVPPYDHPLIIAGQGTAALELMEEVRDLDALVICVGGGGLIAGCATIAKAINPDIRIFGVEPELANDVQQSIEQGERVTIPPPETIADGLRTLSPGVFTFPVIQKHVEKILTVTEEEISEAVLYMLLRTKLLIEPSGAVSVAAVLNGKLPSGIQRVGIIISGGNTDLDFLRSL